MATTLRSIGIKPPLYKVLLDDAGSRESIQVGLSIKAIFMNNWLIYLRSTSKLIFFLLFFLYYMESESFQTSVTQNSVPFSSC